MLTGWTSASRSTPSTPSLMWFRDDLRISDNAALAAAAEHGPVIAVYVLEDPALTGVRALGGAARWWLHHSLDRLIDRLAQLEIPLLIRHGDPRRVIPGLAAQTGAAYVAWSRRYHQPQSGLDAEVKQSLRSEGIRAHSYPGHLLAEPWEVTTRQGEPYRVFTPFSRKLRTTLSDTVPASEPTALHGAGAAPERSRADLAELALLPTRPEPDWTGGLRDSWTPGEDGAWERLETFLDSTGYARGRDYPCGTSSSRLSPHLRFGEISPRAVWEAVAARLPDEGDADTFQKELMWRDFAWHRLHYRPDLATTNVRSEFDAFPWAWDPTELARSTAGGRDGRRSPDITDDDFRAELSAWRAGTTGIPLVDAGMRELWHTGHMHNRVRMVVASFLTKNLGIHWRHGEEWFWDTLVDADPASNAFNWQWAAGCGDDAAPYFRIFNPQTQAARYDPEGVYRARWLPPGEEYPDPIVDLPDSRRAALSAYEDMKNHPPRG